MTAVAAPIEAPGTITILSLAYAISAPAEAAFRSITATVGTGDDRMALRISSAASSSPPNVSIWKTTTDAESASASERARWT